MMICYIVKELIEKIEWASLHHISKDRLCPISGIANSIKIVQINNLSAFVHFSRNAHPVRNDLWPNISDIMLRISEAAWIIFLSNARSATLFRAFHQFSHDRPLISGSFRSWTQNTTHHFVLTFSPLENIVDRILAPKIVRWLGSGTFEVFATTVQPRCSLQIVCNDYVERRRFHQSLRRWSTFSANWFIGQDISCDQSSRPPSIVPCDKTQIILQRQFV
jgi:hypothetical protein